MTTAGSARRLAIVLGCLVLGGVLWRAFFTEAPRQAMERARGIPDLHRGSGATEAAAAQKAGSAGDQLQRARASTGPEEGRANITVTVLSRAGDPIGDLQVVLEPHGGGERRVALTGPSGRASFFEQPFGDYDLSIPACGIRRRVHHRKTTALTIVVDGPRSLLRGLVVDPTGGPVAGAEVLRFYGDEGFRTEAITDSAGRFKIRIGAGTSLLIALHEDFGASQATAVSARDEGGVTLSLTRATGTIRLEVRKDGRPVQADFHLRATNDPASPFAVAGRFPDDSEKLRVVPSGDYYLTVRAADAAIFGKPFSLLPHEQKLVRIDLVPGVRLQGRVLDAQGKPVERIAVRTGTSFPGKGPVQTLTDQAGRFELRHLRPGWTVIEIGNAFSVKIFQIRLSEEPVQHHDFVLTDTWRYTARCLYKDGEPVAGMLVLLSPLLDWQAVRPQKARTDEAGYFRFGPLARSEYKLEFFARTEGAQYSAFPQKIALISSRDQKSVFFFDRVQPATLRIRFVGAPKGAALEICHRRRRQIARVAYLDPQGEATFRVLPGDYWAALEVGDELLWSRNLRVPGQGTVDFGTVVLAAPAHVSVEVPAEHTKGLRLFLVREDWGAVRMPLKKAGRVRDGVVRYGPQRVAVGRYRIVTEGDGVPRLGRLIELRAGEERVLRLPWPRVTRELWLRMHFPPMRTPRVIWAKLYAQTPEGREVLLDEEQISVPGPSPHDYRLPLPPGNYRIAVKTSDLCRGEYRLTVHEKSGNARRDRPLLDWFIGRN